MQANRPVMGIVQDALLGCRLFTKRDTFIEKDVLMNVLMWLEDWDGLIPAPSGPASRWAGERERTEHDAAGRSLQGQQAYSQVRQAAVCMSCFD